MKNEIVIPFSEQSFFINRKRSIIYFRQDFFLNILFSTFRYKTTLILKESIIPTTNKIKDLKNPIQEQHEIRSFSIL